MNPHFDRDEVPLIVIICHGEPFRKWGMHGFEAFLMMESDFHVNHNDVNKVILLLECRDLSIYLFYATSL